MEWLLSDNDYYNIIEAIKDILTNPVGYYMDIESDED